MAYYKYHIFFCLNQRDDGEQCCNNFGADDCFNYMKRKLKSLKFTWHQPSKSQSSWLSKPM